MPYGDVFRRHLGMIDGEESAFEASEAILAKDFRVRAGFSNFGITTLVVENAGTCEAGSDFDAPTRL